MIVNNFSEDDQRVEPHFFEKAGFGNGTTDLISGAQLPPGVPLALDGYGYAWLERAAVYGDEEA
jgi:hypothetical protein